MCIRDRLRQGIENIRFFPVYPDGAGYQADTVGCTGMGLSLIHILTPMHSAASTLPSLPAMEASSSCFVNAAKSEALQSSILFVIPSLPRSEVPVFHLIIFIIKH